MTIRVSVPEMHCAGCVRTISAALSAVPGVESVSADLAARTVAVEWSGPGAGLPTIIASLDDAGFDAAATG